MGSSALSIYGLHDPATLEVIACREALALAADLNVHQFVISSDSKQAVGDINSGAKGGYGAIIKEIKLHALAFNCSFIFESRAVNYEAHSLAKYVLNLGQGRHVWFGEPHDPNRIPLHVVFDE